ncbi:MAG TPA: glycosyltransferase family 2 protein, partial [Bacteroidia bacterium]|nr:glycosyltransferase family 2 protein [Bacteroidia bacterium]
MKSICLFCSYFTSEKIPNYVKFYVKELSKHFTRVVFITNEKKLSTDSYSFLKSNAIELLFVQNEGYDFGMWYKGMLKYNVEEYDRVGLINDSCILFKPLDDYFDWLNRQSLDYAGMTDSSEMVYHIQSYFLIINKKAIEPTVNFFKQYGLQSDRDNVIKIYELGLSQYLSKLGLSTGAWFSCKKYMPKYNPSVYAANKIIKDGFPLIKKKILFNSFSIGEYRSIFAFKEPGEPDFEYNPKKYIYSIINANKGGVLFDFSLLSDDGYNPQFKNIVSLQFASFVFKIKRSITYMMKRIYRKLKIRYLRDNLNYLVDKITNSLTSKENIKDAKIGICLICKDENQYLQEWLDYHRGLGFSHFFIYDNNSKIPISNTLSGQLDCTVIVWKDDKLGKQTNAYFDCCKNNPQFDWLFFIDTDEFLILKKHKTVQEFLSEFKGFKAIGLN